MLQKYKACIVSFTMVFALLATQRKGFKDRSRRSRVVPEVPSSTRFKREAGRYGDGGRVKVVSI